MRPSAVRSAARAVVTAALVACLLAPFSALAQDPGELVVQAIAPDGLPLAGATIVVTRAGAAVAEADTDAAGKWQQSMPAAGDYLVTVQKTGTTGRQNSVEFRRAIPESGDIQLDFAMPLGRVSGRVTGPDGDPLEGARVTLNMRGGLVVA